MAFHINWKPSVKDRVSEIWMEAEDRAAVTAATDLMDERLRRDPLGFGEERTGNLRIGCVRPLTIMFAVFPDDLRVDVVGVKPLRKSSS